MAAVYSCSTLSVLTTASTNAPLVAFKGGADRAFVREIGLSFITAGTSCSLGLCRVTATAVTPTGTVVGQPHVPDDVASTAQLETGWTTLPTVVTSYLKRYNGGSAIGNGIVWRFDEGAGLVVPIGSAATGEIVIANITGAAPGTFYVWVTWEE